MSSNYDELTLSEVKDLLRKWRESNERRSEEVCDMWLKIFDNDMGKLGNEKYVILEQMIFALLDCHQYGIASYCIRLLSKEFPGSLRVMRYQAALLEAEMNYPEAREMLRNIIKVDPTNAAAWKRLVALDKSEGNYRVAICELVDYLKHFMSDVEGWQELCNLYMQFDLNKAAFCADEILLHHPHNHLAHQQRADIAYTLGGIENMELAKTYYSQSLKLNPDNMRALLGLVLVTNNLLTHYKSSGNSNKRKETWKLNQWAQAQAAKKRAAPSLETMLLSLAITD